MPRRWRRKSPRRRLEINTWNGAPTLPTNWREELFRVDHNFTDKIRGTFRYIHDSWEQTVSHAAVDQRDQLPHDSD